jgi:hypothetical protein
VTKPSEFNDRETATVGVALRLIEAMRSRYRAGIMDAADKAQLYLETEYSILQRQAAPSILKKRTKR